MKRGGEKESGRIPPLKSLSRIASAKREGQGDVTRNIEF